MFSWVKHPCQRPLVTLHGVVFDILVAEREPRQPCGKEKSGLPSRSSRQTARLRPSGSGVAALRASRAKGSDETRPASSGRADACPGRHTRAARGERAFELRRAVSQEILG